MIRTQNEILIYKNQYPYRAVKTVAQASEITKVPYTTIYSMLNRELKRKEDIKNGGATSPDGWGFDYLA